MKKKLTPILSGLLVLVALSPNAPSQAQPVGNFEGNLSYKGADLQIRITFLKEVDGPRATLDIPALVYAEQPLGLKACEQAVCTLTFPFGIGDIKTESNGSNEWRGEGGPITLDLFPGAPAPYDKINVGFSALGFDISGTVYIPRGKGPVPGVVLLAGSGTATRANWSYASWADFFARRGVAAIVYDRPGDFEKTPEGRLLGFDEQAEIAAKAFEVLKSQPGVDPNLVGLWGHSRGSWLALATAELVPAAGFLILGSLAVSTPAEQEVTSILTGMEQDGVPETDLNAARTYLRLYFYVAETGQGWPLLEAAIKAGQGSNWMQYVDQPRKPEDLTWWKIHMNFDPRPVLRTVTAPMLVLWGEEDFITPWRDYLEKLKQDGQAAGNDQIRTAVIEGGNHRLEKQMGSDEGGNWQWFGMGPGVFKEIESFLKSLDGGGENETDS